MSDHIYLIVGESGSGKDTLVNYMVKTHGLSRLDSYTTRPRRNLEDRHLFVDDYDQWRKEHPAENIVGYTLYKGNHYWATESQVDKSDLYIIDPAGVEYMKDRYQGQKEIHVVYLDVPVHIRMERMLGRGDGLIGATQRVAYDIVAFASIKEHSDLIIKAESVEDCAEALWTYMHAQANC